MAIAHSQMAWLAERFLNGVPEGIAIALLAWISLRMFGRKSSSARFATWLAALVAIVAVPLARGWWSSGAGQSAASSSFVLVPEEWARDIFFAWLVLSSVALVRVALGLWNLRKLRRDAQ